jgi:hypothetical protein
MDDDFIQLREHGDKMGILAMRGGEDAVWRYEKAVERFERDGAVGAYMQELLALGIDADRIRWHVSNPGRHVAILY